jgi:hypothetical protein
MNHLKIMILFFVAITVISVGCERNITGDVKHFEEDASISCLECHSDGSGPNQGILSQFEYSVHGSGNNTNRNRLSNTRYSSCERCHTSEGFIAEASGIPADGDHFTSFDCFTCHEPHSNGDFRVRILEPVILENGAIYDRQNSNTCATCHRSRRDVNEYVYDGVELSGHWGPHHSNQADMLIGENAYEYVGYTNYGGSWHESGVIKGCPSCHMSASAHESIGGHSWNMKNEERGFENITGCNVEGCHSADPVSSVDRENVADFNGDGTIEGIQTELHHLLDSLGNLLESAGLVDSDHHPVEDRVVSTADSAGALYNFLFVEEDRSVGVHNTDYAVALLKSSINFLNTGNPNGAPTNSYGNIISTETENSVRLMPSH